MAEHNRVIRTETTTNGTLSIDVWVEASGDAPIAQLVGAVMAVAQAPEPEEATKVCEHGHHRPHITNGGRSLCVSGITTTVSLETGTGTI